LSEEQILRWADAHHRLTGAWPKVQSGPIAASEGDTWLAVDSALRVAARGLPRSSSLARLLERERGVRNKAAAPRLSERLILRLAKEPHQRTGRWPKQNSGPVQAATGETWSAIQRSLLVGQRGLSGGDSIVRLLERHGCVD